MKSLTKHRVLMDFVLFLAWVYFLFVVPFVLDEFGFHLGGFCWIVAQLPCPPMP